MVKPDYSGSVGRIGWPNIPGDVLAGIRIARHSHEVVVRVQGYFIGSCRIRLTLGSKAERNIHAGLVGCKSGSGAEDNGGNYERLQIDLHVDDLQRRER